MNDPDSTALSVILITPDRYERIRKTVAHLRAQTIKQRLELIIVAPSVEALQAEGRELEEFCRFRIVALGEVRSLPHAMAAGARAASAPVIAFGEDHAFPDPGWAEALLEAHQGPWAAVGPVVCNANPVNWVSWADFLVSYGRWLDPTPAGEVDFLPSHNCSYKRAILLSYDPELEQALIFETTLHWDLIAKGHRLYVASKAKLAHTNFEVFSRWITAQFHAHALTFTTFWQQHFNYGRGAAQFHASRAQRNQQGVKLEPPSFYINLLCYPFTQRIGWRAPLQSLLLLISQVASALGYFWERASRQRS